MNYGECIKTARKKAGITQKELAQKSNMAEITIRQYETNKREPRTAQLQKIADALEIELSELIGDALAEQYLHTLKRVKQMPDKIIQTVTKGKLLAHYENLNSIGQNKALDYVEDLTKIPEYRKDDVEAE